MSSRSKTRSIFISGRRWSTTTTTCSWSSSTIEQLTILATIFLPLTFITGFFGQNFEWLVRHISSDAAFIVYGLGGLVVPLVLLFLWLRRRMPREESGAAVGEPAGAGQR